MPGFDPFCRFFAEVQDVRRTRPHLVYDKMQAAYDHERPLLGALRFLEQHGFIVCLEDALTAMSEPESEDVPPGVQRTIEVVMQFKLAADLIGPRAELRPPSSLTSCNLIEDVEGPPHERPRVAQSAVQQIYRPVRQQR